MIAEFIDPAILGFILVGVMLFAIFVGFPISFTLIFLGFVFGYFALYLCESIVIQTEALLFSPSDYLFLSLIFALIGHCYPIWFNFRGGKGAATALGAFLFIDPYFIIFPIIGFFIMFMISRFVGLSTISAFFILP